MRILILCTGNSCRSQMAEAFLRSFNPRMKVFSAGSKPVERVNPYAVRVMTEAGIDISEKKPLDVQAVLDQSFDYVITVCGNADRTCPAFTGQVKQRLHMGFSDPAEAKGSDIEVMEVFRNSRDEIRERFQEFYVREIEPKLD